MAAGSQKDWSPGQRAFRELLRWLDEGVDSGGEKYLETRRRLVKYFDRKNCLVPDELADETLNRVARRLAEEGVTSDDPPARYCYIVAKFVFLEYHRRPGRAEVSLDGLPSQPPAHSPDVVSDTEHRANCLENCLQKLNPDQRQLILEYYRGERATKIQNRRDLALKMGLTMNALSIRACRIRDGLEECVRKKMTDFGQSSLKKDRADKQE
jgi:DNA-directed RNA polymerase specialized sigma24 family protein